MYRLDITFVSPFKLVDNIKISAAFLATSKITGDFDRVYHDLKNGNIRFSSAFPKGFLPKPLIVYNGNDENLIKKIHEDKKDIKKKKFVSIDTINKLKLSKEDYFRALLDEVEYEEDDRDKDYRPGNVKTEQIFRNNLYGEKTNLFSYYVEYSDTFTYSDMSIYFTGDKDLVLRIMKVLGKIGLSSRRSIGLGKIKIFMEPKEVSSPLGKLLLSKSMVEPINGNSFYKIKKINLISRNDKKMSNLFVFEEGSWFETKLNGGYFELDNYLTSLYPLFY